MNHVLLLNMNSEHAEASSAIHPGWRNIPLGIMGAQSRALLTLFDTILCSDIRGVLGVPCDAERRQPIGTA